SNDTSVVSFSIPETLTLPDVEGFENTVFPPEGWALYNPDADISWQRTTAASKSGTASMELNAYSYQNTNSVDILESPKILINNIDSININFDVAYSQQNAASADSLQIVYSTDCGATWLPTNYKKGGSSLSTNG